MQRTNIVIVPKMQGNDVISHVRGISTQDDYPQELRRIKRDPILSSIGEDPITYMWDFTSEGVPKVESVGLTFVNTYTPSTKMSGERFLKTSTVNTVTEMEIARMGLFGCLGLTSARRIALRDVHRNGVSWELGYTKRSNHPYQSLDNLPANLKDGIEEIIAVQGIVAREDSLNFARSRLAYTRGALAYLMGNMLEWQNFREEQVTPWEVRISPLRT